MIIHYIQHNFADWAKQTAHMSNLEVGIFTKLRSLYFTNASKANGKIDSNDFEGLCYLLSCKTEEEITSLKRLLKYHFKKIGSSYRKTDWDIQIKNLDWWYQNHGNGGNETGNNGNVLGNGGNVLGNGGNVDGKEIGNGCNADGNAMSNAERTAKAKTERKNIISALSKLSISFDRNAPIATLRELLANNKDNVGNTQVVTQEIESGNVLGNGGNVDGKEIGNGGNAEIQAKNHKPLTTNHKPSNKNKYVSEANEVFEFWKSSFNKSDTTIFSDKRKTKIIKRLEDGYTVEQIKQAIYNCSRSEYHVSNNYTDLELICRDVEKIDDLLPPHILLKNYPKYLGKMGVMFRLPIVEWSEQAVYEYLGDNINPLYPAGFERVGCFPCLAGGDYWKEKAFTFDDFGRSQREKVRPLEKKFNRSVFTSKGGQRRNDENQLCMFCQI